jgi:hypothetical protein
VAKPQHRTPEYRAAYQAIKRAQGAGEILWCVEPVCKRGDRRVFPWQRASVSHDQTGTRFVGPWPHASHLGCNLSEAAIRGNKMRAARRPRWVM